MTATEPGLELLFSADSHVVEPARLFVDGFPAALQDRAPHVAPGDDADHWVFPGSPITVPLGLMAGAGRDHRTLSTMARFDDLDPDVFDAIARLRAQDRDGVSAEALFPTVGLVALQHPDTEIRRVCSEAFNRYLARWCAADPDRLLGIGMSAATSGAETSADLRIIAGLGLRGALLPAIPSGDLDYHDPSYDSAWATATELGLPVCFHIHTVPAAPVRGSRLAVYTTMMRSCQDALTTLVLGGVLERHPGLRVVLAETDIGWLPHYLQRLDRVWTEHRDTLGGSPLAELPSTTVRRSVRCTFQDDRVGIESLHLVDPAMVMWANDYPHADSTWPQSRAVLGPQLRAVDEPTRRRIVCTNATELFGARAGMVVRREPSR